MKRAFDLILTLVTAIFWLPLLLIVALIVRVKLGTPVFFRQERPGLNGKPFRMVKFRSMTDARDANGNLLPDEDRLPAFGRWLRASSMDELPELFNVLKGEMSLVGPRPLLMQYIPRYNARQARRHEVPPGITGWAQVNGRNAIAWDQKFELDVWYVEHRSLWLDCKIILLTILKLFRREDVNAPGSATMPEFMGNQDLLRKN